MKKQTGIWIDFREANLIEMEGDRVNYSTIHSEIDTSKPKGGSRSKTPWGPMDKISEKAFLERRKHEEHAYFEKIIEAVNQADEVYIFGPAEAKDHLLKVIKEHPNRFHPVLREVNAADSMTKNQKIAAVRDFFRKQPA